MTGVAIGMIFGLIIGYHIAMLSGRWKAYKDAIYDVAVKEFEKGAKTHDKDDV